MLAELLRYQIDFTNWASQRVLAAAQELTAEQLGHDFGTSENTILGTLVHIYRAERVWLSRIQGPRAEFRVPGDDTMIALNDRWPKLGEQWKQWAETIDEASALSPLTYQDLRSTTRTQPLWQIILHVANHSTHHRGQAIGFIRALGRTPPNVDSITFARNSSAV